MTTDRYTKTVLTIIAACLLFQSVLALDKAVEARQRQAPVPGSPQAGVIELQPQPVVIVGWDADALARQPLPVVVNSPVKLVYRADQPLPVAINGIKKAAGQWDPIDARVEPQAMGDTPGRPRP